MVLPGTARRPGPDEQAGARRGGRVGVVSVHFAPDTGGIAELNGSRRTLAHQVAEGVRDADLVALADANTLVVLPTEDAATDVNALVSRLREHIQKVRAAAPHGDTHPAPDIRTFWLDPASDESVATLLSDGIATSPPPPTES